MITHGAGYFISIFRSEFWRSFSVPFLLEDPPYLKEARPGRIDFIGFGLLIVWIGCLQIMLDKGQDADWLSSNLIRWLAFGAGIGFIAFL